MFSDLLSNGGMKTNDEIRRENLAIAVGRMGKATTLATKAGVAPAYLSQLKAKTKEQKTGTPKAMGDDVARRIEKAIGELPGWMDTDHSERGSADQVSVDLQNISELISLYSRVPPELRHRVYVAARGVVERLGLGDSATTHDEHQAGPSGR
ncbi:MAG: putative phage repressor [Herminiimonas sp.]|nr:putative phage repressor [Herminiimonas sp.]